MPLRGFATVSFWAADHAAAKRWYTEFLGVEPYFERPGYFEFRLGDYQHELGVIDSRYAPGGAPTRPGGAVVYWHVDDVKATFDRLLSMGAKQYEPPTERGTGTGFVTASVVDPFGNILGIMSNPHYLAVLDSMRSSSAGTAGRRPSPPVASTTYGPTEGLARTEVAPVEPGACWRSAP